MAGHEPDLPWSVRLLRRVGGLLLAIPRRWGFVPALLWAGLIFFGSSRPVPPIGVGGAVGAVAANFAHALEYGVFAVCLALSAPRRAGWVELPPRAVSAILLLVLFYASSDEWHQSFTPHRDASVFDVITDVAGASATLACIAAVGARDRAGRKLLVRFAVGFLACVAAAALATWGG